MATLPWQRTVPHFDDFPQNPFEFPMAIFEYRISQIPANVNYKALQNIGKYQDISVKSQPNTIGYPLALKLTKSLQNEQNLRWNWGQISFRSAFRMEDGAYIRHWIPELRQDLSPASEHGHRHYSPP